MSGADPETEQTPETGQPEDQPQLDEPSTETETDEAGRALQDAPSDVDEATATGYAVYNRTLGQFVPGVEKRKPTSAQATKRVPDGHTAAVVRV